ncbi:MAG TPA: hypothetical protein VGO70_05255 [Arsenicitalea sp.]|jgi:uncharacterized protein (TIGR03492 family)|nr:hypothetical protein [Arsenicitalea sp.]
MSVTALVEPVAPRRILFISNGHGEDSIAAAIVSHLPANFRAEAYPTLGSGGAYAGICPVVGPRAVLPSEGWRNVKGSLGRDIGSGGLGTVWPGLQFMRRVHKLYDHIVVVGDLVGVAGCLVSGARNITYLDVYKTGFGRPYSAVERWLIKRTAQAVFCRSDALAQPLREAGIDARCAGNVMMDAIPHGEYDAQSRRGRDRAITLLPGSRHLVGESFGMQIAALRRLDPDVLPDIFLAVAGSVSPMLLADAAGLRLVGPMTGEAGDLGTLSDGVITVHMARGAIGNLLDASDLVLSQAGTATIQSLGLGKPAITFINPRDRGSRVRDENALFGEARVVVEPDPGRIAATLQKLLTDDAERARLSAIGRERIGGPGAMAAIVASIAGEA